MATETEIQNQIDTDLASASNITALELRGVFDAFVGELYSTSVVDDEVSETYTTKAGTNISYSIRVKKVGNNAWVKLSITNETASTLTPQSVFTWKDTEYKPKATENAFKFKANKFNGTSVDVLLNDTGLSTTTGMSANSTYETEFIYYITQD